MSASWRGDVLRHLVHHDGVHHDGLPAASVAGNAEGRAVEGENAPGAGVQGGAPTGATNSSASPITAPLSPVGVGAKQPQARAKVVRAVSGRRGLDGEAGLLRRIPHGDTTFARFQNWVMATTGSAGQDVREVSERVEGLRLPVSTCRRITVLSSRGGAGKSTLTALVGAALARYRADHVLAVDADPDFGSLGMKVNASSRVSLRAFGSAAPWFNSLDEAAGLLGQGSSGLWVLTGEAGRGGSGDLTDGAYRTAMGALSRFMAVALTDGGPGLLSPINLGALYSSHALLLAASASVDGVVSAKSTIERFAAGEGAAHTVVALVETSSPTGYFDLQAAIRHLRETGASVFRLPYDRHLAAGTSIDPEKLATSTWPAVISIAGSVLAAACR